MSIPQVSTFYKTSYSMVSLLFNIAVMWIWFSLLNIDMTAEHIQVWFLFIIYMEIKEISLMWSKVNGKKETGDG